MFLPNRRDLLIVLSGSFTSVGGPSTRIIVENNNLFRLAFDRRAEV
jgi:hypothetical protein